MISAKIATLGFLKRSVFLSHNSNYIVDEVMWPKFGNCNIYVREVNIISIL